MFFFFADSFALVVVGGGGEQQPKCYRSGHVRPDTLHLFTWDEWNISFCVDATQCIHKMLHMRHASASQPVWGWEGTFCTNTTIFHWLCFFLSLSFSYRFPWTTKWATNKSNEFYQELCMSFSNGYIIIIIIIFGVAIAIVYRRCIVPLLTDRMLFYNRVISRECFYE